MRLSMPTPPHKSNTHRRQGPTHIWGKGMESRGKRTVREKAGQTHWKSQLGITGESTHTHTHTLISAVREHLKQRPDQSLSICNAGAQA